MADSSQAAAEECEQARACTSIGRGELWGPRACIKFSNGSKCVEPTVSPLPNQSRCFRGMSQLANEGAPGTPA